MRHIYTYYIRITTIQLLANRQWETGTKNEYVSYVLNEFISRPNAN